MNQLFEGRMPGFWIIATYFIVFHRQVYHWSDHDVSCWSWIVNVQSTYQIHPDSTRGAMNMLSSEHLWKKYCLLHNIAHIIRSRMSRYEMIWVVSRISLRDLRGWSTVEAGRNETDIAKNFQRCDQSHCGSTSNIVKPDAIQRGWCRS